MTTLREYRDRIEAEVCPYCNTILPYWIERRDHLFGYAVTGFDQFQWLFITCAICKVEIGCNDLGLKQDFIDDSEDD